MIDAQPGESIWRASDRVIRHCDFTGQDTQLRFNGITVRVYPGSRMDDIVEKWDLKRRLAQYDDVS